MTDTRPRAAVHIGLEKTGSTYLQEFLHTNAEMLRARGHAYPTFLGTSNHHALAAYALDARPAQDIHRWNGVTGHNQEDYRRQLRRQLGAAVADSSSQHWLFTCEHLSSRLTTQAGVDRCVDLLRACGLEPQVLLFLRPQEEMIESTFSTAVISGATASFDLNTAIADRARYDYAQVIARWEKAVGRSNVVALEYPHGLATSALAELFCESAGIEIAGLELPEHRTNASIPYAQAEFLRLFNAAAREVPEVLENVNRARLHQRLRALEGPPFTLGPEERRRVRDAFRESNDVVLERYGVDLGLPEPAATASPGRQAVFGHDDVAAFLRALAASSRPAGRRRRRQAPATGGDSASDKRRSWLSQVFGRSARGFTRKA
jgi:hypothetical protein